jgi:hypothetical protein
MAVPLVGLRISISDRVIRITRGRPGQGVLVIKSTYTGPVGGGAVVGYQSLMEARKDEVRKDGRGNHDFH